MVRPQIVGKIIAVNSKPASFKNPVTGAVREFTDHSVDLVCSLPEKGVASVKVYSDKVALAFKEGAEYLVCLRSFSVDKGVASYLADEAGFVAVSKS